MKDLKKQLIRLGHQEPSLRKHLVPVLDRISSRSLEDRADDIYGKIEQNIYDTPKSSLASQALHLEPTWDHGIWEWNMDEEPFGKTWGSRFEKLANTFLHYLSKKKRQVKVESLRDKLDIKSKGKVSKKEFEQEMGRSVDDVIQEAESFVSSWVDQWDYEDFIYHLLDDDKRVEDAALLLTDGNRQLIDMVVEIAKKERQW